MIQSNSRVEMLNGIKFYEQDILFDDYSFTKDIKITLVVDYISPGIGIALMNNEGMSIREKNEAYLFRLGYKESSVVYRNGDITKKLSNTSVNVAPLKEQMTFTFIKKGRDIKVTIDNLGEIINFSLPRSMDKYNIGFYSNAGNIIKNISIASLTPNDWGINMQNTEGGYIRFFNNGFSVENCTDNAELEQFNVLLNPGVYFFKYETEEINNINDIKSFIFKSNDDRIFDEEKNILNGNKIELTEQTSINIKFKGTNGIIKNISITDKINNVYVPTFEEKIITKGSEINVNISTVSFVEWTGVIQDTPDEIDSNQKDTFAIIADDKNNVNLAEASVVRNKEYSFKYIVSEKKLIIYDKLIAFKEIILHDVTNNITIFKNMNAVISKFSITKKDGEVINFISEKTSKRYVPATITSPILVIDEDEIPLDISSSYRVVEVDNKDKYIFTNYEREIFEPNTKIKLTNKLSNEVGTIKAYGILNNAKINFDNLLRIKKEGIDNIELFCDKYDTFNESDLYYVDRISNEIYFNDVRDYQMIIIDYLKKDSYSINHISKINMYEVDISTDRSNVTLLYDNGISNNSKLSTISNYKQTDLSPKDNCYIVIRR